MCNWLERGNGCPFDKVFKNHNYIFMNTCDNKVEVKIILLFRLSWEIIYSTTLIQIDNWTSSNYKWFILNGFSVKGCSILLMQ